MSTTDINKVDNEEDSKTLDKQQIELEEKEVMLKGENENTEDGGEPKTDNEGLVKAALSGDVTEQGREVKPKFIPIGAIKMPGFFTRNVEKDKSKDEEAIEKENEIEKSAEKAEDETNAKPKFKFLQTFTQFLHRPQTETDGANQGKKHFGMFNVKYPKMFQKRTAAAEATLASMETLEDKLDTPNDGMENVKLDMTEPEEGKVATRLPLKERIRQKKFIMDDIMVCVVALVVLLSVIIGIIVGARAGPPSERPLRLGRYITTLSTCGPVEGILDEGVYSFYGIPYASPPVEEKRFTYAQPLNDISMCWNGTLQAHERGPLCMQFLENGTIVGEEDCLTLDIVTPHVRYDSPLPVVVLIGANSLAGGISPAQPSALYARTKEVVFVRPNFRLGPFGFLALDILSNSKYPATSGNYALSDLVVALQWINYNIKHFGGDPESVTLLGHRAGATLTAALTTTEKAQKLYSRVWLSSASVIFPGEPLDLAQKNNEQFKQISKCNDADCLRRKKAIEILTATPDIWLGSTVDSLPLADEFKRSWLVLDGDYLRTHAYESWDAQKEAKEIGKEKAFKPMVFGTTQHSGHSVLSFKKHINWTSELVERMVNESYIGEKNLTNAVFKHFNKTYEGLVELISSVRTLCPLVSLARLRLGAPLYVVTAAGAAAGPPGAGVARVAGIDADVEAILGTFDSEMPEQRRFMAAMQQLFYYYVWHGHLPGPETGLIAVGQDLLPLPGLPVCDLLIREDVVPRYAHVD
ncbi:neurotactin [Epargyreus clarus]|uniref:neurotactin n=1 Tax=Epargyreus clarus TaxID=520877 RepID=UPI003C2D2736